MTESLVSIEQALFFREIGFDKEVCHYTSVRSDGTFNNNLITRGHPTDWNHFKTLTCVVVKPIFLSIPTLDEAIEWLRCKYDIIVFHKAEPFIITQEKGIQYSFGVKKCSKPFGWNARRYLGFTEWTNDINKAKREAIQYAIEHLKSQVGMASCQQVSNQ